MAIRLPMREGLLDGPVLRTYWLHPYQKVRDAGTGVETADAAAVLDGDLDQFIRARLAGRR